MTWWIAAHIHAILSCVIVRRRVQYIHRMYCFLKYHIFFVEQTLTQMPYKCDFAYVFCVYFLSDFWCLNITTKLYMQHGTETWNRMK